MKRVVFHPEADLEVVQSADWYDSEKPGLGASFLDEIDAALRRISATPDAFGTLTRDIRMHLLHHFPYGIVYRVEADRILVIAVMHLHREPHYWEHRT
jgi:toxin ParE1/3/4